MCGICGKLNFDPQYPISLQLLKQMNKMLIHRGPDDEGYYLNGRIGLAHRRLSIIDLVTGKQPLSNEDNKIWIVFNGEIYNHVELRNDLLKQGHQFKTKSDTEVIIHLYEEYGTESVKKLNGMFAFAVWDERKQRLFLARDRVGQKPLIYAVTDKALLFASEIKSILQDLSVKREVDFQAIHYYLTYLYIPSPKTIFKGIYKLPPAHYLVWENGKISIERYWKLSFRNKIYASEEEYCEQLWELLKKSTQIRLMSDVPLGAFLSGGIDSSGIVGIMTQLMDQPVKTFSIGYEDELYNELPYARQVAQYFKTDHHEFIVKPNIIDVLPKLIWHYNEPFADASSIPTYYVSKMTRDYVTVALSGDAGDENFAGYNRYVSSTFIKIYQKIPPIFRDKIITNLIQLLPNWSFKQNVLGQLKIFIQGASLPQEKRFAYRNSVFTDDFKALIYTDMTSDKINDLDASHLMAKCFHQSDAKALLDKLLDVDIQYYLPDDILVKVDIASMANSLEVRSPFLDHHLIEFAAGLPADMKLKGLTKKYILKKCLTRILPKKWLHRKKMGFQVPTSRWFREELKDYVYSMLLDNVSLSRGYFRAEGIAMLLDEHITKKNDHDLRIWALLNFELWHRMFIDTPLRTEHNGPDFSDQ